MHISRRYVKKHGIPDPADEVTGYENMDEVCKDLEEVVDVLWFSGTPSLQIPYLLNVALAFNTYLPAFPPSPRPTFALLKKLDHCFASLIVGRDVKLGDPLPGFEKRGFASVGFTSTDMVRCKSLADETRMLVAMVMSNEPDVENWTGADDDDGAMPPPRRRIVDVSVSTGLIQEPVDDDDDDDGIGDNIKSEDVMGLEEDESDSNNGEEPNHATSKRKSNAADLDSDEDAREGMMRESLKRIKFEEFDDEFDPAKLSDAAPGNRSPDLVTAGMGPPPPPPDGKFHFMGGDDDDDSDDETAPNSTSNGVGGVAPSVIQITPNIEPAMSNLGGEGEGEEEEEEEEEELQLNVGKVYERTLVQLGKSLGESITDDPV